MTAESNPKVLFDRWYAAPLRLIETLPNGDGAFVALAVSLSLYERFAKASIKKDFGQKADDVAFLKRLACDFQLSEHEARTFWEVMRHGFQHQAMPMQSGQGKSTLPRWLVNGVLPKPIQFGKSGQEDLLLVQPWLFRDAVLDMYNRRPDLIAYSQSFAWASIFPLEFSQ